MANYRLVIDLGSDCLKFELTSDDVIKAGLTYTRLQNFEYSSDGKSLGHPPVKIYRDGQEINEYIFNQDWRKAFQSQPGFGSLNKKHIVGV